MAFNATACLGNELLAPVGRIALQMKAQAERESADLSAGGATSNRVIDIYTRVRRYEVALDRYADTPGIGAYAQAQIGDADIAADFTEMANALAAVATEITNTFPKNAGNYLLGWQLGASGLVERQFTAQDMAGLVTRLNTLAASVV